MTASGGRVSGLSLLDYRRNAALLDGVDLAGVRRACGISQATIAEALRLSRPAVSAYEHRVKRPPEAYCRVVAGMLRHLEVTW